MFAIFTRLTRDEGPPLTERLVRGPSRFALRLRAALRWARASTIVPITLVASLMIAIVAIGIATATSRACPRPAMSHQVITGKGTVCQPSANGLHR